MLERCEVADHPKARRYFVDHNLLIRCVQQPTRESSMRDHQFVSVVQDHRGQRHQHEDLVGLRGDRKCSDLCSLELDIFLALGDLAEA